MMVIHAELEKYGVGIPIPKKLEKTANRWLQCMSIAEGEITFSWPKDVIKFEAWLYSEVERSGIYEKEPTKPGESYIKWYLGGE